MHALCTKKYTFSKSETTAHIRKRKHTVLYHTPITFYIQLIYAYANIFLAVEFIAFFCMIYGNMIMSNQGSRKTNETQRRKNVLARDYAYKIKTWKHIIHMNLFYLVGCMWYTE